MYQKKGHFQLIRVPESRSGKKPNYQLSFLTSSERRGAGVKLKLIKFANLILNFKAKNITLNRRLASY